MAKMDLPESLRSIVKIAVALLGAVIERELGRDVYVRIERIRRRMAAVREFSDSKTLSELRRVYKLLEKCSSQERIDIAVSYTLMLELMNTCENAYRTYRLRKTGMTPVRTKHPSPITYVLTAHPTESRSSKNISIFYEIQKYLVAALERGGMIDESELRSLIEVAWRVPIVRSRKPTVEDEAEHLYSVALREENLETMIWLNQKGIPIYLRSWVGGDKDGHPGVDQDTLLNSLQASRDDLHAYARKQLENLGDLLHLFPSQRIQRARLELKETLSSVHRLRAGDGARMKRLHSKVLALKKAYNKQVGETADPIRKLEQLLHTFPALVIPLELREDSGMIMKAQAKRGRSKKFAIERMLKRVAELSRGGNPRWYAQGFIISMCQSIEHIEAAANLMVRTLGALKIRVIPLFEQAEALKEAPAIMEELLKRKRFKEALKTSWLGRVEIMLGYSDSSKESGAFPSRLEVSTAMRAIDKVCRECRVQPIYFHGSGGSVDRGGGPIEDQLASWSKGALAFYKATIQGEMVERSFASPEIAESQLLKIARTAEALHRHPDKAAASAELLEFASKVTKEYKRAVSSQRFMTMVELATPYKFLSVLKMGSRPTKRVSKRKGSLAVTSLRAIPWVLCWTQTRVLFPTWWGLGSAWLASSKAERNSLKRHYKNHALFRSFVNVLGFTLAKVEMPVFHFYLERSSLPVKEKAYFKRRFDEEFAMTQKFFLELTGHSDPLWFRPWLAESIVLRSAMIHPLNLLQSLAQKDQDLPLLRIAVTGVASGMLTTG
ncbi:MAG: phosphoenolpyruvate carboxylase [Bdellovibrionales bacterium]|nr:phosphoenolpyruvate carboxylase [Bdellovibrionales bacterium]